MSKLRSKLSQVGVKVHLGRRAVTQCLVRSIEVVELKIVSKPLTDGGKRTSRQGARRPVVRKVDVLVLDRTPEPLGEDVVESLAEACASA